FTLSQRQLQRTVAAELRPPGIDLAAQLRHERPGPDAVDARRARVAEHPLRVRVRAAADDAAVAEHHEDVPRPGAAEPGSKVVQRHAYGRILVDGGLVGPRRCSGGSCTSDGRALPPGLPAMRCPDRT